jgi:succinate dehydrogenase / fumarate reductase cytochrome b subunit
VTTATASDLTVPLLGARHHFLLRRLHSLTGILFGGYIIIHLLVNATLAEGSRTQGEPTVFQQQVDKIHSLPFLLFVEWVFIYLPIIYHTIYGIWITLTGQPNVDRYAYAKNWAYVGQRISAIILAAFILFHVLSMKGFLGSALAFNPSQATQSAVNHFHAHWWIGYVIYPIGILAATYHLANGFWTAAITWGLTISAKAQQRWGMVCAGIFVLTFVCATTALVAALHQSPSWDLATPQTMTMQAAH